MILQAEISTIYNKNVKYYKVLHMTTFLWYVTSLMMGFIHNPKHDAIKLPNT